jgi:hypothetical protein
LWVPEGALPDGVDAGDLSVTERPVTDVELEVVDEAGRDLGVEVLAVLRLEPDGVEFTRRISYPGVVQERSLAPGRLRHPMQVLP